MATFSISGPGGEEYEITAPDEASALRAYHGMSAQQVAAPTTEAPNMAADIAKTVAPGLARGVAGTIGLPNTILGAVEGGLGWVAKQAVRATGRTPASEMPGGDTRSSIASGFPSQEQILKPVEAVTGPLYRPKTIGGEVVNTLAEFAPNALFGGGSAAQRLGQVVAPALVSEGAGQVARVAAPEAESYARFGGALVGGVGAAVAQAPKGGAALMREGLQGISPDELAAAQALRTESRSLPGGGVELPLDEALNRVTDGKATRLSQISRVVAHSGGEGADVLASLYAQRPAQIDRAARGTFDLFGPVPRSPSALGLDVQDAAQAGLRQTPEGMALTQAIAGAGPRTTADQAGQVIQPALRATADLREAVRAGQAARDYSRARQAPETVGIERNITVERPGEPVVTQPTFSRPEFTEYAPRPLEPYRAGSVDVADGPGESLARFIAKNGGLRLDGDAAATDLHRFVVPGVGKVAREDGKSLDSFWRERLIEEGYFRRDADGGAARDISSELLRKLQNEQRGFPSYALDATGKPKGRRGAAKDADEYDAALSVVESRLDGDLRQVGVDPASLHPDIRKRTLGALMRGEDSDPLQAYERTVSAMKGPLDPYVKSTVVTEQIPDVRFGQVNPTPALDAIGKQARFAKGDVQSALGSARRDLYEPGGKEMDLSVQGLLKARERLDYQIRAASEAGDGTKARDLAITRDALDRQLKAVPEVATADANFAANSRALEPFTGNRPLAQAARRDDTGWMATPAEQVPAMLGGATATRELMANASPAARQAQERYWTTRLLEGATDAQGNLDGDKLALAMRENSDVLAQMPDVTQRLQSVVQARFGLSRPEASPLGQVARTSDTRQATEALFPARPLVGSQDELGAAMGVVTRNSPQAAQGITRQFLEGIFNDATQETRGLARQYGGAGFASRVRGTPQLRQNLEASVGTLPEGAAKNTAMDRLLTALEATGYRPQKGSDTAFNTEIRKTLANGTSPLPAAIMDATTSAGMGAAAAGTGGALSAALLGLRRGANEGLTRMRVNRGGSDFARMLLDRSTTADDLRAFLQGPGATDAQRLLIRLLGNSGSSAASGNAPNRSGR
ncbi:hypothetical protein MKK58_00115 [Methylobacterium sp. J-078]|uniref:hypothetical protein n=1 Tax=Methylobacterium sp. J-078 TaxID=2836657 RepID=UPI001FB86BEF|nr:hypothetical protein [Methylobacterium sp. J-078]MCJ2042969.1 hypothetical protein [Methylobacterium sp. J-078]